MNSLGPVAVQSAGRKGAVAPIVVVEVDLIVRKIRKKIAAGAGVRLHNS